MVNPYLSDFYDHNDVCILYTQYTLSNKKIIPTYCNDNSVRFSGKHYTSFILL